jgi:hypothetical protein
VSLSKNPAVIEAYEAGTYTDLNGMLWRRGMDGWFHDLPDNGVMLTWHHHFVEMIEREHPET